jgi:hypothetical protein
MASENTVLCIRRQRNNSDYLDRIYYLLASTDAGVYNARMQVFTFRSERDGEVSGFTEQRFGGNYRRLSRHGNQSAHSTCRTAMHWRECLAEGMQSWVAFAAPAFSCLDPELRVARVTIG